MESSMHDIHARIARLAIALRVPLASDADITAAIQNLKTPAVAVERRSGVERRSAARLASTPERRGNNMRAELRALLVLRYGMEARLAENLGWVATNAVMAGAHEKMTRHGFEPGAGGSRKDAG